MPQSLLRCQITLAATRVCVPGVPCPGFSLSATAPTVAAAPTVNVRNTKDQVKVPEFPGSKGYGSPDDVETWMQNVARAIKVNSWKVEDAFEIVQGKLIDTAATWYQNRETLFDKNPLGLDEG